MDIDNQGAYRVSLGIDQITYPFNIPDPYWETAWGLPGGVLTLNNPEEFWFWIMHEDVPGLANVRNEFHPIYHYFDEYTGPIFVNVTKDPNPEITIVAGADQLYNMWISDNFEAISVDVTPKLNPNNQAIIKYDHSVVVLDAHGNPAVVQANGVPAQGVYTIRYTASLKLNDGTVNTNFAERMLTIRDAISGDTLKPHLFVLGERAFTVRIGNTFTDQGANANTPPPYSTPVAVTTTFTPPLVMTASGFSNGLITLRPDGITYEAIAEGTVFIDYRAVNNGKDTTARRTITIEKQPDLTRKPRPYFVLPEFSFSALYHNIKSIDTIFAPLEVRAFREPGHPTIDPRTSTPAALGVKAFYMCETNGLVDISTAVTANYSILLSLEDGDQKVLTYSIAETNDYETASATRLVFVIENCDTPPYPPPNSTLSANNANVNISIAALQASASRGIWPVSEVTRGWNLITLDQDEGSVMDPFKLVGYDGFNIFNPPLGGPHTLRLVGVGACGRVVSAANVRTKTVTVNP